MNEQKENNEKKQQMNDDEWIDANLKLICENNGGKIIFINRKRGRANKKDRTDLGVLFKIRNLAEIGDMKSFLLPDGIKICEKFNGSWFDYLDHKNKQENKEQFIESVDNQNKIIDLLKNYWWLLAAIILIIGYFLGRPLF